MLTFDVVEGLLNSVGLIAVWSAAWCDFQHIIRAICCEKLQGKGKGQKNKLNHRKPLNHHIQTEQSQETHYYRQDRGGPGGQGWVPQQEALSWWYHCPCSKPLVTVTVKFFSLLFRVLSAQLSTSLPSLSSYCSCSLATLAHYGLSQIILYFAPS